MITQVAADSESIAASPGALVAVLRAQTWRNADPGDPARVQRRADDRDICGGQRSAIEVAVKATAGEE